MDFGGSTNWPLIFEYIQDGLRVVIDGVMGHYKWPKIGS